MPISISGDGIITGNVTIANTISVTGNATFSSAVTGQSSVTGAPLAMSDGNLSSFMGNFKNKIINGNFDVWQWSTNYSFSTSAWTAADKWVFITDGTSANTITSSRQTFTPGQTDVPDNPKYYLQLVNNGNNTAPSNYLRTDLEGVNTLAGQTATLSFWAKCASGSFTLTTYFQQEFGTGGSPSAGYYPSTPSKAHTITTTWTKFTWTFTLDSITGKTLGTNNNDTLNIAFVYPGSNGTTLMISQVQLEQGSVATRFETRSVATETALCQRYYYKMIPGTGDVTIYGSGCNESATVADAHLGQFPTTMRATPTVAFGSSIYWFSAAYGSGQIPTIKANRCSPTTASLWLNITGSTAGQGGVLYSGNNNPSYGYIEFDARI